MKNKQKGFGFAGPLIVIAIIGIVVGGVVYISNIETEEETILEQRLGIIDKAKEAKKLLEERNTITELEGINISSWETYKNEEYGFEIKYPSEWVIDRANNDKQVSFYIADEADIQNDFQFTIAIIDKELWGRMNETTKDYTMNPPDFSEVIIADQQAKRSEKIYQNDAGEISGVMHYVFIKDGSFFSLLTRYFKESDGVGEKIISTFKFTD